MPLHQNTEILYQISLSIGTSQDLQLMLRNCLGTMLRTLNATAISVLAWRDLDSARSELIPEQPRVLYNIPSRQSAQAVFHDILRVVDENTRLPLERERNEYFTYAFALSGVGVLLLNKRRQSLGRDMLISLQQLLEKLAVAINACFYERRLKREVVAAQAANTAKSNFLANMSHELRTPMTGIIGMIDLVAATQLDALQSEQLKYARRSAEHLLDLINDVLDLSKVEAGSLLIELSPVDVLSLAGDILSSLAPSAWSKGLVLRYEVASYLPARLLFDPVRLRQILVNLLGNAVKFTEKGVVILALDWNARSVDSAAGELVIRVHDTGVGIAAAELQRIFEPFFQADSAGDRAHEGTGLGLSIVAQFVQLMSGTITLRSEIGKCSEFTVTLPAEVCTNVSEPSLVSESTRSVLVLAEDKNVTRLITALNQRVGWQSRVAHCLDDVLLAELTEDYAASGSGWIVLQAAELATVSCWADSLLRSGKVAPQRLVYVADTGLSLIPCELRDLGIASSLSQPVSLEQYRRTLNINTPARSLDSQGYPSLPEHVLLAEDNPVNRKLIEVLLSRQKIRITSVSNGMEAVEAWRRGGVDLILMDMMMPVMDGLSAVGIIRNEERLGDLSPVPVIAITANAMVSDREKYLAAGMQGYVSKPFNAPDLFQSIQTVMSRIAEKPE